MVQKETPPLPPTEKQEAEFKRAQAHEKLVWIQRERLWEELTCLDEEIASAMQIGFQADKQSLGSEGEVVFSPSNDNVARIEEGT